jgi:hypothetical protein
MTEAKPRAEEAKGSAAKAELDTSEGWCCDGRTYKEHAHADGKCCQPKGQQIEDLPPDGQEKARERQQKEGQAS